MLSPALLARANSGLTFRPTEDTVLWYPGQDDVNTSTLRDRSDKSNDGTITGAPWTQTGQGLWGLTFAGDDDIIALPTTFHALLTGSAGITFWCWFKASSFPASTTQDIIMSTLTSDVPKGGLLLGFLESSGNKIRLGGRSQAADSFQSFLVSFTDTTTYHFMAGIWDFTNATLTLVVDDTVTGPTGVTWGSATHVTTATTTVPTIGGESPPGAAQFNGDLFLEGMELRAMTTSYLDSIRQSQRHLFGV